MFKTIFKNILKQLFQNLISIKFFTCLIWISLCSLINWIRFTMACLADWSLCMYSSRNVQVALSSKTCSPSAAIWSQSPLPDLFQPKLKVFLLTIASTAIRKSLPKYGLRRLSFKHVLNVLVKVLLENLRVFSLESLLWQIGTTCIRKRLV